MNKSLIAFYYLAVGVVVLVLSVVIPFQYSEKHSVEYMNARMKEIKEARGVKYLDEKSEEVLQILNTGTELQKEKFTVMSGMLGFLSAVAVSFSTLLLRFTHSDDFVWLGAGYLVLYGLGAFGMVGLLILLVLFIAHGLKKRQESKRSPHRAQ